MSGLDGEELSALLLNPQICTVSAAIPKFEYEWSAELSEALMEMGVTDAFDVRLSDFSGIGEFEGGKLVISGVLHKAYIAVDERGTKAGAATVVAVDGATSADPTEVKYVTLDRPFVYMLIDCESNIPIFIGTVNQCQP